MKHQTSFILSALLCVMIVGVDAAHACRCLPPPPPKEAMEKATVVFSGRVVSIKPNRSYGLMVTFEVDRAWKGVDTKTFLITTSTRVCGRQFVEGKAYLVYATAKEGDRPSTNLCDRTRSLDQAAEDLKALGEGKALGEKESATLRQ